MTKEFYAQKVGMTTYFTDSGVSVPVTVLRVFPMTFLGKRSKEKHGYEASLVGFGTISDRRKTKPLSGFFSKINVSYFKHIKEVSNVLDFDIGSTLNFPDVSLGSTVDITGLSKGKGFSGAMKRHNFGGLRASHGVSISHRSHGSTGGRQDPGKVFKNKKMAGQFGNTQVTVRNLSLIYIDLESWCLYVKGAVPGSQSSLLKIRAS